MNIRMKPMLVSIGGVSNPNESCGCAEDVLLEVSWRERSRGGG